METTFVMHHTHRHTHIWEGIMCVYPPTLLLCTITIANSINAQNHSISEFIIWSGTWNHEITLITKVFIGNKKSTI
ncbi:hypothetical protein AQUCO_03800100v1 [Aquilegia coerulea]|uniref:Uncharacterized protein n=1 Tax=Aquilegia coerulea TaxID=218851 RepID=A0A2G5CSJ4_AQUCA|nr:hypothetical protein AQUCO_03800100v1 [Aquilegia coerulea]